MSFEWGKVELPKYLPLGAIVMLSIIGTLAWADLHTKADQTARQLAASDRQRELLASEFKAKDAELSATVAAMREQGVTRQEALLTRLTRIETILERLEKRQ